MEFAQNNSLLLFCLKEIRLFLHSVSQNKAVGIRSRKWGVLKKNTNSYIESPPGICKPHTKTLKGIESRLANLLT